MSPSPPPTLTSSIRITPNASVETLVELTGTEGQPLEDNPFCQATLEVLPLLDGLELMITQAVIHQDLTLCMTNREPTLMFNITLAGHYYLQLPDSHRTLITQAPRQILCGYHPELADTLHGPTQACLQTIGYGITPAALTQLTAGQPLPKRFYPLLDRPESTIVMLPALPLTPQLDAIVQQILHCPYQGAVKQLYLQGKTLELLALYFNHFDERKTSCPPAPLQSRDRDRIQEAKARLLSSLQDPPTLIELAHAVGTNQEKLKQGFRECFGTTVFGCLREARLEEAYQLLLNTSWPINVIASHVGYHDPKHFAKVFRAKFGKNPSQVRSGTGCET